MKLIIEIPEEVYEKQRYSQYFGAWSVVLQKCFENGTPLTESYDCISRKAVIDITWEEPSYTDALNVLTEVRDKVKALPPVNPQESLNYVLEKIKIEVADVQLIGYATVNDKREIASKAVMEIIDKYRGEKKLVYKT